MTRKSVILRKERALRLYGHPHIFIHLIINKLQLLFRLFCYQIFIDFVTNWVQHIYIWLLITEGANVDKISDYRSSRGPAVREI